MKKYFLFLAILVFAFCGNGERNSPGESAAHREEQTHKEGSQDTEKMVSEEPEDHEHPELHLSPDKQKEWGIILGNVARQSVSSTLDLPGILTVNQNRTAYISSYVRGKVIAHSADLGDRIHMGQSLVTINSPAFAQAQADFLRARAKYLLSQKEI